MTPAEFKARLPEFSTVSDEVIQDAIDEAAPFFNVGRWSELYPRGLRYFVAHILTLDAENAAKHTAAPSASDAGDNVGKKVGDVSVTKGESLVRLQMKDSFMRTKYGQLYAELRDMVGIGGVVTGGAATLEATE